MRMLERNAARRRRATAAASSQSDRRPRGRRRPRLVLLRQRRRGAARARPTTKLHAGDHVWWDRHDWSATESVPAVVGSFPEPFVDGYGGKRLPLRIECTQTRVERPATRSRACSPATTCRVARAACCARSTTSRCASLVGPYATLDAPIPPPTQLAHGAGRERRLRALRGSAAARSRCSTRAGRVVRTAGAGRRPDRGDPLPRTSRRSGSSPAPTPPASPPRSQAFNAATLDEPLRRRRRRRRARSRCPTRGHELPAPREPAARRARERRRGLLRARWSSRRSRSAHPLVLGVARAGRARRRRRARASALASRARCCLSVPMALLIVAVNALVSRDGLTVLARLGDAGPLGQLDVTLEALAYGAEGGARADRDRRGLRARQRGDRPRRAAALAAARVVSLGADGDDRDAHGAAARARRAADRRGAALPPERRAGGSR